MGNFSSVYGKIVGARHDWGGNVNLNNDNLLLHKLNRLALEELPETDEYPQITKQMFNTPAIKWEDGLYKYQIISFGASYKEVEESWLEWVLKFENILKTLYWDEAVIHLETALLGERVYRWKNKNEPAFTANPSNTSDNWDRAGDDIFEFDDGKQ